MPPAPTVHDFDFNFGVWNTHIRRVLHPLSGKADSIELHGAAVLMPPLSAR
jgi:hypothetical protein